MPSTRNIVKIRVRQIEGRVGQLLNAVVLTVETADIAVRRIAESFKREHPDGNAGYWKVDTEVLFDDGAATYTRLDVDEFTRAPFAELYGSGNGLPTDANSNVEVSDGR